MFKKFRKLCILFIFMFLFLMKNSTICEAEVDVQALEGYFNGVVAQQNIHKVNDPKYASKISERVDPVTGRLELRECDLSFPGKDGLDLNINRIYNSSEDEYEKKVDVEEFIRNLNIPYTGYVVEVLTYEKKTNKASMQYFGPIPDITTAQNVYNYYMNYEDDTYLYETVRVSVVGRGQNIQTVDYTKRDYIDKYSYNKTRYYIGAGWSFGFPSVQIKKEKKETYLYYHDGTGASYRLIPYDSQYYVLAGYPENNVFFEKAQESYYGDGTKATYIFTDKNFTESYFAEDGRILGIKDRLGNEITFTYQDVKIYDNTYRLLSVITDTIGRKVNFKYSDDKITLTVTVPGETDTLRLTYNKTFCEQTAYDKTGKAETYTYPVLASVTDEMGQTHYYERFAKNDAWPAERFTYSSKKIDGKCAGSRYLIGAISYDGVKTVYDYDSVIRNLGADGVYDAYRITSRTDETRQISRSSKQAVPVQNNVVTYSYEGDCSGYPTYRSEENIPVKYSFSITESQGNGIKTKTSFDGKKRIKQIESQASNQEKNVVEILSFDENYETLPVKQERREYLKDGTLAHTWFCENSYNEWGGIQSETGWLPKDIFDDSKKKEKYTTTYEYNNGYAPFFVTKKSWYQSDDTCLYESYNYDRSGRLISYRDAGGYFTKYSYGMSSDTEEPNYRIEYVNKIGYNGKSTEYQIRYGKETKYAYPTEIHKYYMTNDYVENRIITRYTYHMLTGLLASQTEGKDQTVSYEYDKYGRTTKVTYPKLKNRDGMVYAINDIYTYTKNYNTDYADEMYSGIFGTTVSKKTEYTDTSQGTVKTYNATEELYDSFGNLRYLKNKETGVIKKQCFYDNNQFIIKEQDAAGDTISQSYDAWGQVNQICDSLGNLYITEYDKKKQKEITYFVPYEKEKEYLKNPASNQNKEEYLETQYDDFGQIIQRTVYEDWPHMNNRITEHFFYDLVGNVTGYIDPNGNKNKYGATISYQYDGLNRIIGVYNAKNQKTEINYSLYDTINSIEVDGEILCSKEYNEAGLLTQKMNKENEYTHYWYNNLGQYSSIKRKNGYADQMTYDALGQIQECSTKKLNHVQRFTYLYTNPYGADEVSQYEKNGNETEVLTGRNLYQYDSEGRILSKMSNVDQLSGISYQYDKAGRITQFRNCIAGASTKYISYRYNKGRLSQIQTNGQQTTSLKSEDNILYEYYADGKLKKITYPTLSDGEILTAEYQYNGIGQITAVINKKNDTVLSKFQYSYDKNGNITKITDLDGISEYSYDSLNQLVNEKTSEGEVYTYTYDRFGNRLNDKEDNLAFEQDAYERVSKIKKEKETLATMRYNTDGLRKEKEASGKNVQYYYDESGHLISEKEQKLGGNITNYTWGPDRVLKKEDQTGSYYYLYNAHGDVVQVVDSNGTIVNNYSYDAWGNITESVEKTHNPFRYAGYVYDTETELYYLNARFYNPKTGRFLTEDTYEGQINRINSMNTYAYCYNNPLRLKDSNGNTPRDILIGIYDALIDNGSCGIASLLQEITGLKIKNTCKSEADFYAGRVIGDIISGFSGSIKASLSLELISETIVGGVALVATTAGTTVVVVTSGTVSIVVGGTVVLTESISEIYRSSENFGADLTKYQEAVAGKNGSSSKGGNSYEKVYKPSPKHNPNSGWGSPNPIPDIETGQKLLDNAYSSSKNKQLYNVYENKLIKFQPDTVEGWHAYEVTNPAKEVPTDVLRQMLKDGKITNSQYKGFLKNIK